MKWEDYKPKSIQTQNEILTDIECPNCGEKVYKRLDIILASNPPQYVYECKKCGWKGYNY